MYFGSCQRHGKGPVPQLAGMLANNLRFHLNLKETQPDILYNHVKEVVRFEGKLYTFFSTNHMLLLFLTLQKKGTIKTYRQFSFLHFTVLLPHRLFKYTVISLASRVYTAQSFSPQTIMEVPCMWSWSQQDTVANSYAHMVDSIWQKWLQEWCIYGKEVQSAGSMGTVG